MRLLLVMALGTSAFAQPWTQRDYVQEVLRQSPEIEATAQEFDAARRQKTSALASGWLPNATASASAIPYGHNPQNRYAFTKWKANSDDISYNTNVSLNLFNSFKDYWTLEQAALDQRLAGEELVLARRNSILKAIETYQDLILKNKNLAALDQNLQTRQEQHDIAQKLYQQGMRSLFDIQKTQIDLYSIQQRLLGIRNEAILALAKFNWLINKPGEQPVQTEELASPSPGQTADFENSWTLALRQKPDLIKAKLRVERSRVETRRMGQKLFPELNIKADWNWQNSARFGLPSEQFGIPKKNYQVSAIVSYSFGLGHVPQWQGYMEAKAKLKAAQANQRDIERRVKEEIFLAILDLERLRASYAITLNKESIVKENAAYAQERYRQGQASILEITEAQQDLLSAQLEQAALLKDYHLAMTKYKMAVGTPLDEEALP